jgi:AhpD family alkylhydroperoxidase
MQARMKNPAMLLPDALPPMMALAGVAKKGDVPGETLSMVHLRVSQINGCSFCVDMHAKELRKLGAADDRIFAVSAWRESPAFTDAERAALALAEAATRLSDRSDPVPDEVWNAAAAHFAEPQLALLVLNIALTNMWNRLNVTIRQPAGSGWS